jgi:glycosyltransferase involved in cell wall biosynthesis
MLVCARMAPPVSFVIPTRNQARFIRQCIDSCVAQQIPGAEIVVVDGASTDGTQDILRGYGDRVRFVSEPDRGQSDAINKGVRMARGELVAWINSDDYYAHGRVLATVLSAFASDPRLDIVHGDGMFVDVEAHPFRYYRSRPVDGSLLYAYPTAIVQPSLFFRRQLFLDVGGLREDLHWAMDLDLWLRLFPAARASRYLPEVLSCMRCHADAKTFYGMWNQIAEVRRLKRAWARDHRINPLTRLRGLWADAKLYVYWAAVRSGLRRAA